MQTLMTKIVLVFTLLLINTYSFAISDTLPISQENNIPAIQKIIEMLAQYQGKKISVEWKKDNGNYIAIIQTPEKKIEIPFSENDIKSIQLSPDTQQKIMTFINSLRTGN